MPDLNTAGYRIRRTWSDQHLDQVKKVLGKKFVVEANFKADTERGIDLVMPTLHFAVRIRQTQYSGYKDFTLRSSGGGGRSEYAKLLDVRVRPDFLFYAFSLDNNSLMGGYLIDLTAWHASLITREIKPMFRRNKDGSHFVAFPFKTSYSEQII